jgi:hypothetical protein
MSVTPQRARRKPPVAEFLHERARLEDVLRVAPIDLDHPKVSPN